MHIGSTISHYKIVEKLGEGGMGVVYKAEDTKLKRTVALKFLAAHLLSDEEAKERFLREAQAAAALHHSNVCPVYEIDEADGKTFLAMAFLEGEALEDRIARGPLPLKEALDIARQVAEGLEAAHEKAIVHRDIKPANIIADAKGHATIMDFGLARLTEASRLTKTDSAMGTVAYMSPEQAQGTDVDHRSDVWSLGCVLYEMVSGLRPFQGQYDQALLYEIVHEEVPPLTSVRAGVPMELEFIVGKCLAKDRDDRTESAREVARELRTLSEKLRSGRSTILRTAKVLANRTGQTLNPAEALPPDAVVVGRKRLRNERLGLAALAVLAIASLAGYLTKAPSGSAPGVAANLTMEIAPATMLGPAGFFNRPRATAFAISPDGATVVFAGATFDGDQQTTMLYRRPLAETQAVPIPGTEKAQYPFFSPDGQWVGFADALGPGLGKLKKVSLDGGPPIELCDLTAAIDGAAWGSSGLIAFASNGLWTVPESGGKPEKVLEPGGDGAIFSPTLLPGDHMVVFTQRPSFNWAEAHVDAIDLSTKQRKTLLTNASDARFSPTGHLVFTRNASLLAVPFDASQAEIVGSAVPLLAGIMQSINAPNVAFENGMGQFALSASGTLIYAAGGIYPTRETTIVRVDRAGSESELVAKVSGALYGLRLSADAKRAVATKTGDGIRSADLWLYDLAAGTSTRLTSTNDAQGAVWAPDGKSVLFTAIETNPGMYSLALDANSTPERIMDAAEDSVPAPTSWSPDGAWLAYVQVRLDLTGYQIFVRPTHGVALKSAGDLGEPRPFSPSTFRQEDAYFSPDGRWLTYTSNESGQDEVYVQSFPGPGEKRRISNDGGFNPAWSRDGRQLFYLKRVPGSRALNVNGSTSMMAVDVTTGDGFRAGVPHRLFDGPYALTTPTRSYDVTPDGQFVMVRQDDPPNERVTKLNVVLGWADELQRRVPSP